MATPAIKVEGLGKRYRLTHGQQREGYRTLRDSIVSAVKSPFRKRATTEEFWALDDVSFEVQPGEVVGIIGRNGAGKSTLLKILSRITKPTRGHIEINGRVGSLLEVGTGFHPELTGRDNVYLNGSILGMSRSEVKAKFDEIVAFAEVEKFLDTPVKRYSSGMYVRLAFAVAAHLEPEILIVDEVLAVGDSGFQKKCLGKIGEIAVNGRTVLLVTHNLGVARSICSRGIVLDRGHKAHDADVDRSIQFYSTRTRLSAVVKCSTSAGKQAQIVEVSIAANGSPSSEVEYGDDIELRILYRTTVASKSPKLGYVISNELGDRIINGNMHYLPSPELTHAVTHGKIICSLGRVPLMAGTYTVSLWFGTHGQESEHLPDIISFVVIEKDFWKSGQLPPRGASAMWWPTQFAIEETIND